MGVAIDGALDELEQHFRTKGGVVPFTCDRPRREYTTTDADYVTFVADASARRGLPGVDAKEFEVRTARRLATRLTGHLHRVGSPRDSYARRRELDNYLKTLGFDKNCLDAREKDGGLELRCEGSQAHIHSAWPDRPLCLESVWGRARRTLIAVENGACSPGCGLRSASRSSLRTRSNSSPTAETLPRLERVRARPTRSCAAGSRGFRSTPTRTLGQRTTAFARGAESPRRRSCR